MRNQHTPVPGRWRALIAGALLAVAAAPLLRLVPGYAGSGAAPLPLAERGRTLSVGPAGSDIGQCGEPESPCRQIGRALALAGLGDTVLVAPGSYDSFEVTSPGVTIRAQQPDRRPVISWKSELGQGELIRVRAGNVTIDGLAGYRARYVGLRVYGDRRAPLENVTIRNCVFGDNGELGIMTNNGVTGLQIEGNVTYGSRIQHGIYVANDARRVVIRNNLSFANADAGIQVNGENGPGVTDLVVRDNVIYGNGEWTKEGARRGAASIGVRHTLRRLSDGSLARREGRRYRNGPGLALYHVREAQVFHNLLFDNYRGIATMSCGGTSGRGLRVVHNTVVMRPAGAKGTRAGSDIGGLFTWNAGSRVRMLNNLFCAPPGVPEAAVYAADTASDHNLFVGDLPTREGGYSRRVDPAEPVFVDPARREPQRRDYRPHPDLSVYGVRLPECPADLAGNLRGARPTPGALEKGGPRRIHFPAAADL